MLLIGSGASTNQVDGTGNTKVIIRHSWLNYLAGRSLLHLAISYNIVDLGLVAKLINSGIPVDIKDNNASTALHEAVRFQTFNPICKNLCK